MKTLMINMLTNVLTLTNGWKVAGSRIHRLPLIGRKDYPYCLLIGTDQTADGQPLFTLELFNHEASVVSQFEGRTPVKTVRTDSWGTVEDIIDGWVASKADPDAKGFEQIINSYATELEPA